ncbi:hypothetical protein [Haloarcula halophila]|uniref:hypothetical protein n=1 Tax=Haloarcula TaxID=2237 RepID=UPI0023E4360A|nr:hypothetical protein [Halomicroarcula sp. DFY41]
MELLGIHLGFIRKLYLALVAFSVSLAVISRGISVSSVTNGIMFGVVVFSPVVFWDVVRVKRNTV